MCVSREGEWTCVNQSHRDGVVVRLSWFEPCLWTYFSSRGCGRTICHIERRSSYPFLFFFFVDTGMCMCQYQGWSLFMVQDPTRAAPHWSGGSNPCFFHSFGLSVSERAGCLNLLSVLHENGTSQISLLWGHSLGSALFLTFCVFPSPLFPFFFDNTLFFSYPFPPLSSPFLTSCFVPLTSSKHIPPTYPQHHPSQLIEKKKSNRHPSEWPPTSRSGLTCCSRLSALARLEKSNVRDTDKLLCFAYMEHKEVREHKDPPPCQVIALLLHDTVSWNKQTKTPEGIGPSQQNNKGHYYKVKTTLLLSASKNDPRFSRGPSKRDRTLDDTGKGMRREQRELLWGKEVTAEKGHKGWTMSDKGKGYDGGMLPLSFPTILGQGTDT